MFHQERLGHAVRGHVAWACRRWSCGRSTARRFLSRIEEYRVTPFCGAPAVVAAILTAAASDRRAAGRGDPGAAAPCASWSPAAAPPPSKTIERVEAELGWEFIQIYGLTETAPLLTINRAVARDRRPDRSLAERARLQSRAGVPAVGVQIRTDEDGEVLARSQPRVRRTAPAAAG